MLREAGHSVALYDPFFAPDRAPLADRYDFIICTEVAEHFHRPAKEFRKLNAILRPRGFLGIMTLFQTDDSRFAKWRYRRDPTHVVFYRSETMQVLAKDFDWECKIPARNVVIFRKKSQS